MVNHLKVFAVRLAPKEKKLARHDKQLISLYISCIFRVLEAISVLFAEQLKDTKTSGSILSTSGGC